MTKQQTMANNINREEMVEFLVHCAALLRLGHVQALTISMAMWGAAVDGKTYLTEGCSQLDLLKDQLRMLDP